MSAPPIAALVRLSGFERGRTTRFASDVFTIGTGPEADLRVSARALSSETEAIATRGFLAEIHRLDDGFEIRTQEGADVSVNGRRVGVRRLEHGDLIQLGGGAEVLRFRCYESGARVQYKSVGEAWHDSVDAARHGGGGWLHSAGVFVRAGSREILTETAPWFRAALLGVALLALGVSVALWMRAARLEAELAAAAERVAGLSELVERGQQNAMDAETVRALRERLESGVASAERRLSALEERAGARARVIAGSSDAVLFLQGAYGFKDAASGRPLRFKVAPGGGAPLGVTLEGEGPLVEIQYTGTAFLVSDQGLLVTNRHVALPWEGDGAAEKARAQGFEPEMRRFIGYPPGSAEPVEVALLEVDESVDVALLVARALPPGIAPLALAESLPGIGDDVVVLGYPTGIHALLARADPALLARVESEGGFDFWRIAGELADAGSIAPLATAGVVGQVAPASVVYDAETTHGGSGGPVLAMDGRVVAVNAAILPQFGGSNLGVPIAYARRLVERLESGGAGVNEGAPASPAPLPRDP